MRLSTGRLTFLLVFCYVGRLEHAAVAAVNGYLRFIDRSDCCVHPLRVQRTLYRERRLELTREEYFRLLRTAEQVSEQTVCMLETICATGIRVSELRYITVEAVRQGFATVRNKGKCRTILLPRKLQTLLIRFCKSRKKLLAIYLQESTVNLSAAMQYGDG